MMRLTSISRRGTRAPVTPKPNLSRDVIIFLSRNGVFRYAKIGTRAHARLNRVKADGSRSFLPASSVATFTEARAVRIRLCSLTRIPGSSTYIFPLEPNLDGLYRAGERIEKAYIDGGFGA